MTLLISHSFSTSRVCHLIQLHMFNQCYLYVRNLHSLLIVRMLNIVTEQAREEKYTIYNKFKKTGELNDMFNHSILMLMSFRTTREHSAVCYNLKLERGNVVKMFQFLLARFVNVNSGRELAKVTN